MNKRLLLITIPVLVTVLFVGWTNRIPVVRSIPTVSQDRGARPCNSDGPSTVTITEAREAFLRRGFCLRPSSTVRNTDDLVGSIIYLSGVRSWLYVQALELRYDARNLTLAISRLQGSLPDGRPIQFDKTRKLPSSFQRVSSLSHLGPVLVAAGGAVQTMTKMQLRINSIGAVIFIQVPDESGDGVDDRENQPCQGYFGGNCRDVCFGDCRESGGDPCDCDGVGFCYLIPGLHCQGKCEVGSCLLVSPNPGAFFCACA